MMLKKTCKCGKIIGYKDKCCDECARDAKKDVAYYDRYKRDKDSYAFYHSQEWLTVREVVMARYNGLCLYSLFIEGQIVPADVVHQAMSLLATSIGGTAFGKNRTEIRAITREDVKGFDMDAIAFGETEVQ